MTPDSVKARQPSTKLGNFFRQGMHIGLVLQRGSTLRVNKALSLTKPANTELFKQELVDRAAIFSILSTDFNPLAISLSKVEQWLSAEGGFRRAQKQTPSVAATCGC